MRATRVRTATHVGCDSAHPSPLIRSVSQAHNNTQQHLLCWGCGSISGPADAGFDPEELSPRILSPCHQLLPANYSAGWMPEPQGSLMAGRTTPCPARTHMPPSCGQLLHNSCGDVYLGKSRGSRISTGLNQLRKGPSAALPFLHFFVHRVHLRGSSEHLILQPVSMVTGHQHLSTGRQLFAVAALVDGDEPPQSGCEGR